MFIQILNTPRNYDWGSKTAIAELFDTGASGLPEAELWLGAHPGSPAHIRYPSQTRGAHTLDEWIKQDPEHSLGASGTSTTLPFLFKVLAADSPLSLQAHPGRRQAKEGFARENAMHLPLDSPERNYKDDRAKPEIVYALSDSFDALCGFRPVEESIHLLKALADKPARAALEPLIQLLGTTLNSAVTWILTTPDLELHPMIAAVVRAAKAFGHNDPLHPLATVRTLSEKFPDDPGLLIAMLLNRVRLKRGEALHIPAGTMHAYLRGLGMELMASSDNVLRGGLTSKHVDVTELLAVIDFSQGLVRKLIPGTPVPGLQVFRTDSTEFQLVRTSGTHQTTLPLNGPAIAACIQGRTQLRGRTGEAAVSRGEFLYVTPDEGSITIDTGAEVFIATSVPNSYE